MRVLLVDDERRVLDGLTRILRRDYQIVTADSGEAGLLAVRQNGPFAVVVSDMRMPGINGAEFLSFVRDLAPSSVRILLTGFADVETATAAVNNGQIFRFLHKPCPPEQLEGALRVAVDQHRMIVAERELLESTLRGSVEVLTDILALVSPVAFARAIRLKRTVADVAAALVAPDAWTMEVAALLSQLGAINVHDDVLQRFYRGDHLGVDERAQIAGASESAQQIIGHIPRLEKVRAILAHVHEDRERINHAAHIAYVPPSRPLGARLLVMAMDYDHLESRGLPPSECLDVMEARKEHDAAFLAALRQIKCKTAVATGIFEVRLCDVRVGMVFARDVVAANGLVLIGRGQVATPSLVRRIQSFWLDQPLKRPVEVTAGA